MVTPYHRRVQKTIRNLGKKWESRFEKVFNDKRPVHIQHPMDKGNFLYFPDVAFRTKIGKLYLFEVIDSEQFSQAQIVAHVLETILTPQALKVFFIVQDAKVRRTVANITEILVASLSDLGMTSAERVQFQHVIISRRDSQSPDTVERILVETDQFPRPQRRSRG